MAFLLMWLFLHHQPHKLYTYKCVCREKNSILLIVTHCWATNISSKLKYYFPSSITGEGEENSFFPNVLKRVISLVQPLNLGLCRSSFECHCRFICIKTFKLDGKCAQMFSGPGIGWSETCPALFWIYNLVLCHCKSHLLLCNRFSLRTFAFSLHWWVFLSFLGMGNTIAL